MTVEFQGTLCATEKDAHILCAAEWLSAGGPYGPSDISDVLKTIEQYSDSELAQDCVNEFEMQEKDWFDMDELISAFAEVRENPYAVFGWNEGDEDD